MTDTIMDWSDVNLGAARYWSKLDYRYPYAVLQIYNGDLRDEKNMCGSLELAQKKYQQQRDRRGSNWQIAILTAEQFNELVKCAKQGRRLNMQALPNPDKGLANKLVHVVWNQTEGKFVKAFETAEAALKHAQGESQRNPINSYLLLTPSSRVFQPVNVLVEAVVIPAAPTDEVGF